MNDGSADQFLPYNCHGVDIRSIAPGVILEVTASPNPHSALGAAPSYEGLAIVTGSDFEFKATKVRTKPLTDKQSQRINRQPVWVAIPGYGVCCITVSRVTFIAPTDSKLCI